MLPLSTLSAPPLSFRLTLRLFALSLLFVEAPDQIHPTMRKRFTRYLIATAA
jgi:hypothetical protein